MLLYFTSVILTGTLMLYTSLCLGSTSLFLCCCVELNSEGESVFDQAISNLTLPPFLIMNDDMPQKYLDCYNTKLRYS